MCHVPRANMLSELNVLTQIKHIKTYPFVMQKLESGELHLSAWFFEIDSAQLSALIGVAPFADESGHTSSPRHVRGGRATVRHVLYMAAVSASHSNPILTAFYQRLRANGKPAKVCLVAVMRKMACLMNRMLQEPDFVLA